MDIIEWDGTVIKEPGCYSGVPIEVYHNDQNLLPGPSVSKSSLKSIAPPDGSPKKFWQTWAGNPKRIKKKSSEAMDFGKAVHALILGDEVFDEKFSIRPSRWTDWRTKDSQNWRDEQIANGFTVITEDQIDQIRMMAEDLAQHPLVLAGGLNGQVEVSMFARDPDTGIWLKSRPDNNTHDGAYVDLKTAGSLDQNFLERQFHDAGYYLQPAMTKMVCDLLGIPFVSFTFLYTLTEDYADSDFRVADEGDILLGETVIRYGLGKIRHGLDTGEWPGINTYNRENHPIRMSDWPRNRIKTILKEEGISI